MSERVSCWDLALQDLGSFRGGPSAANQTQSKSGPVTLLGLTQRADGCYMMLVAEGETVPGPTLEIGNTTSRVDFGGSDPGEFVDAWSASGPAHHWALGVGHHASVLDAYGLGWTAQRLPAGVARRLGDGRHDARGLRMEIIS